MVKKSRFKEFVTTEQTIVKDINYFKLSYTPEEIIERKETFELYRELSIFTKYRKSNNIILKGFPGSGKTVTINFIRKELSELFKDIDVIFDNCSNKSTLDILKILINEDIKGNSYKLKQKFLESIKKDTLIILDEIDRSNKIEDLLYFLSRPKEIDKDFDKNISLVLISNNLRWEENLRDSIRSSLQLKQIIFSPYSKNELRKIIKDRIKKGLKDTNAISEESINLISEIVSREKKGDCRVAIEAIFYAAQIAESKNKNEISKEYIHEALKNAINQSDKLLINKLKDNQLLTLYVVSYFKYESLDEIHKSFVATIKKDNLKIDAITKVMIFHIINYLDDLCLIHKTIETKIEEGIPRRRTKIQMSVNPELIIDELAIRGLRLSKE